MHEEMIHSILDDKISTITVILHDLLVEQRRSAHKDLEFMKLSHKRLGLILDFLKSDIDELQKQIEPEPMENDRPKHKCYEGEKYVSIWERLGEYLASLYLQSEEEQSKCNCCDCQTDKPPLGLTPKFIRDEQRQSEILAAVNRFITAGKKIPVAWIEEYNELVKEDSM